MRQVRSLLSIVAISVCSYTHSSIADTRNSVVYVTGDVDGAGVVIGADEQRIFVATAAHVAQGSNIHVRFRDAPDHDYNAIMFRSEPDADFAVLAVSLPSTDPVRSSFETLAYRSGPVPSGTGVSNIGHPAGELWQVNAGVNKIQGTALLKLTFSSTGIAQGSSGGPLFDEQGRIIGIVLEENAAAAKALKWDAVWSLLSDWGVRTNLLREGLPQPLTCNLSVRSTPSGADVFVGNQRKGSTPLTLTISQTGTVDVRIEKSGYLPERLTADCSNEALSATLQPDTCKVAIRSTPPGAEIYVEGGRKGVTPLTLNLTRGDSVDVRLTKEGFISEELTADCSTENLSATLQPATGSVTIVYVGDAMGCNLQLSVTLGGKKFIPTSNQFQATNVPLGMVDYGISGRILCPTGVCNADGSGTLDIEDGDTLYVGWLNTGYAACSVELREP